MSAPAASHTWTWEVRQFVSTAREGRFEVIDAGTREHLMRLVYQEYVRANPQGLFQLIKVFHSEECLAFSQPQPATGKRSDG